MTIDMVSSVPDIPFPPFIPEHDNDFVPIIPPNEIRADEGEGDDAVGIAACAAAAVIAVLIILVLVAEHRRR